MQSVSAFLANRIGRTVREPRERITVTWAMSNTTVVIDPNQLTTSITTDRSVSDAPEEVSLISGGSRATTTITLSGAYKHASGVVMRATDLMPARDTLWSMRSSPSYGIRSTITIESGFKISDPDTYEYVTVFTGYISRFSVSGDTVTITATDESESIRGRIDLPTAAGNISPHAIEDLALRSGGKYLTPKARTGALVSIPNCVTALPEVGDFRLPVPAGSQVAGRNFPLVTTAGMASCEAVTLPAGTWVCVEGWVKTPLNKAVYQMGVYGGTNDPYQVFVHSNGAVSVIVGVTQIYATAATAVTANTWTYIGVGLKIGPTGQIIIRVGGTSSTSGSVAVPTTPLIENAFDIYATFAQACEGFQMWTATTTPTWNNTFTPNYTASIEVSSAVIKAIIPTHGEDAWQVIQDLAAAEGAVVSFDEHGVYRRETRDTWNARRYGTPALAISGGPILDMGFAWGSEGIRKTVEAALVTPTVVKSTLAAPAWQATETYTCPANSSVTFEVATDTPIFDLAPTWESGHATDTLKNYRVAVRASEIGDPAIKPVFGVRVRVRPIATGLRISIKNSNPYEIALWTKGDGGSIPEGPYLVVHGSRIVLPEPKTLSVEASPTAQEVLVLPDNRWRQSESDTLAHLQTVASDVVIPQLLMDQSVRIASDPRIQLGDVVTIDDSVLDDGTPNPARLLDGPTACLVVGVSHDFPSDGANETSLALRIAYPIQGWVLGISDRSQLDSTTLLVL